MIASVYFIVLRVKLLHQTISAKQKKWNITLTNGKINSIRWEIREIT